MTAWRRPTTREQREDYAFLRGSLPDDVARRIAAMPVILIQQAAVPFALRGDAWLYRTGLLLGRSHR